MISFYSHGKLLLTGEYTILKGANALAVPCRMGQTLNYRQTDEDILIWKSYNVNNIVWFEVKFKVDSLKLISTSDLGIWKSLLKILRATKELNLSFLSQGGQVDTFLEFDRSWGLGSSSTLISNIASWANINPYRLLGKSFGGSGYDIACAQANGPLTYIRNNYNPNIEFVELNYPFIENLFFVHLNKKKDSQKAVALFDLNKIGPAIIKKINELTKLILNCNKQTDFNKYLKNHERILASILNQRTVQDIYFSNFKGAIKSLGAWGGDFILVSGDKESPNYFKNLGFTTIIPFEEMIL